ncbi:MAG: hypothetical protein WD844_05050 [Thermoleophilaceae bacterium]
MAREVTAPQLAQGDPFPTLEVESVDGPVALSDRWTSSSLVIAFMRHFG